MYVSARLRPDAASSPDGLFCHLYGCGENQAQPNPGWPYSFIAAAGTGPDLMDRDPRRRAARPEATTSPK
ncbi:hypothetical protein I0C86_09795 [Plantactinospora sp. S1510]|uniref:Uncharacterized protein n=1 Tax=Plantactinospora alkalitolerans TaxID=2789879 RepID=A0ABS0GSU7_9ACTN|nr:hypothetical protein [Plantactinospora alkalitolerans]MBF9129266.1 hypothetical protein [Plantactinospora alkalitolerans]